MDIDYSSPDVLCSSETGASSAWDNDWHIASLFIIIGTSALGVFLPIISRSLPRFAFLPGPLLQFGQFFGAGVIISTAMIHIFPSAHSALTNPCLGNFASQYGAWASLFAMMAIFTMHSFEWWLFEAWLNRSSHQRTPISAIESGNGVDDDSVSGPIYPLYAHGFDSPCYTMPPPVLSPAINPYVFSSANMTQSLAAGTGAPSVYTVRTGFALSRYGNYAALVQSRQHLAMMQNDRLSRYISSDPQFPLYAPSMWPMPPTGMHTSNAAIHTQEKSTPELMRRMQQSNRTSNVSSSGKPSNSSRAVSLRPNSFTNPLRSIASKTRRSRARKQRCLSMPRLAPTTLEAAVRGALLEPLPTKRGSGMSGYVDSMPQLPRRGPSSDYEYMHPPHPASSKYRRQSSQTDTSGYTSSSSQQRTSLTRPQRYSTSESNSRRLDTVHEADDSWGSTAPYVAPHHHHRHHHHHHKKSSYTESAVNGVMATVDEETSTKPTKRVSLSTPPTTTKRVYNSSASEMSDSSGNVPAVGNNSRNGNAASPGGSTVIHSPGSTIADMPLPVDVKRRAMATYILEVGIALYSVLVGLALAVSDKDFTVMLVAICFHQFFEGLALGSSLAELYWIKAQLSANGWQQDPTTETDMSIPESPGGSRQEYVNVDFVDSTTFPAETVYPLPAKLPTAHKNKSHRTLISMATSFTPEPWQVNPQLERTLGEPAHGNMPGPNKAIPQQQRHQGHAVHPIRHAQDDMDGDAVLVPVGAHGSQVELSRYLQPRTTPERLPGWWKAWISGLAFTMTTPLGIVIGLAVRHVYEPHSKYALLLNGVLESICAGVLVYTGLITMVVGGFSSLQVKQFKRMFQVSLFLAVYMGAAAMASLKIWK